MIGKIPSLISKIDLSKLELIVKMAPAIKEFFSSYHTESESYLLNSIKKKDGYIIDKKADISKLRKDIDELNSTIKKMEKKETKLEKKIKELEENLDNTSWMLTKKQEELDGERR